MLGFKLNHVSKMGNWFVSRGTALGRMPQDLTDDVRTLCIDNDLVWGKEQLPELILIKFYDIWRP